MENMKQDEKMCVNETEIIIDNEKQVESNCSKITENKYMMIHETNCKVPLLSKKGYWAFNIKGTSYKIPSSIERYWVYLFYGEENKGEIAEWIRDYLIKNATPMQIDDVIDMFVKTHPVEQLEIFNWEQIPLYADDKLGLIIPLPYYSCTISKEQEQELLDIVRDEEDFFDSVMEWFADFREEYGLDYSKKLKDDQDYYLALNFLQQHGIGQSKKKKF